MSTTSQRIWTIVPQRDTLQGCGPNGETRFEDCPIEEAEIYAVMEDQALPGANDDDHLWAPVHDNPGITDALAWALAAGYAPANYLNKILDLNMRETITAEWTPVTKITDHPELHSTAMKGVRILVRHILDGTPRTDWAWYYTVNAGWIIDGGHGAGGPFVTHFLNHRFDS